MAAYVRPRPVHLTERQFEVLCGVADGLTNAQIGARLHLTEETVKRHVRELRFKLRARDRAHAVHRAWQEGYFSREIPRRTA